MKFLSIIIGLLCLWSQESLHGQDFVNMEKELMFEADVMMNASLPKHRKQAFYHFDTLFESILQTKSSFQYPFDSLTWISKKQPDDLRFRIFTGIIDEGNGSYFHFGWLQTNDGKLYTLKDHFKAADDWEYSFTGTDDWMGAMYYDLKKDKDKDGNHYLLFGIHRFDEAENCKILDVLFFEENGQPVFGKEIFRKENKGAKDLIKTRIVLKYEASSFVGLHYNENLKYIVHDHLIPKVMANSQTGMTLISDGSLVGYEKKGEFWQYIDKIYTQTLDEAPRPKPVLDKRPKDLFGKEKNSAGNKK